MSNQNNSTTDDQSAATNTNSYGNNTGGTTHSGGNLIFSGSTSGTITILPQSPWNIPSSGGFYIHTEEEPEEKEEEHPKANKIELPDGTFAMDCVQCDNQHQWAEPNQENGTFKCYECRELRA